MKASWEDHINDELCGGQVMGELQLGCQQVMGRIGSELF